MMMMRNNNYGKEMQCKLCSNLFIKTRTTGNQCTVCRKKLLKPKVYQVRKVYQAIGIAKSEQILDFIERIDCRGGYLYNLKDFTDLLDYWQATTRHRADKYDMLTSGEQLHKYWMDLLKWRDNKYNTR